MDLGALFFILGLALLVAAFLSRPFLQAKREEISLPQAKSEEERENEHMRSSLLAERDRVLTALQELDFDYQLGKIPEEDYPLQRASLMQEGASALRHLDALDRNDGKDEASSAQSAEERLEEVISARRADAAQTETRDEVENLIATRRRQLAEKSAGFCPKCGKPVQKSDAFCARCGADLRREAAIG